MATQTKKRHHRILLGLLGTVPLSLAVLLSFQLRSRIVFADTAAPSPYTVKLRQSVRSGPGATAAINATLTIAVRRDGARAVVHQQFHRPDAEEITRNVELPSGERFTIGDLWELRTSWKRKAPPVSQWYRDPKRNCGTTLAGGYLRNSEVPAGEEKIGPFRTVKLVHGNNAEWFALDYGCALVQAHYDFGSSVNDQHLISLVGGDPDSTLFVVPSSFREVAPSTYGSVMREHLGLPCGASCLEGERQLDRRYHSQHQ